MINLLKSLNANYDPSSRACLTETLLENEVDRVNICVNKIIEKMKILLLVSFFT